MLVSRLFPTLLAAVTALALLAGPTAAEEASPETGPAEVPVSAADPAPEADDPNGDEDPGGTEQPTEPVKPKKVKIKVLEKPTIKGTIRYRKTLKRTVGKYDVKGTTKTTRWYRDGKKIPKATGKKYKLTHKDVGKRITVKVTVKKKGHVTRVATSKKTKKIKHIRDARVTVNYTVTSRGTVKSNMGTFRKKVDQILNDPRGWRRAGVKFKRVKSGGSMVVVLSQPSLLPTFHPICSSFWSCRVGSYVIINDDRWRLASPAWNDWGKSRASYRHMVVNHETGHWLGHGHRFCGGAGKKAPVMQQQSKGMQGCKPNPWPTKAELKTPRYG